MSNKDNRSKLIVYTHTLQKEVTGSLTLVNVKFSNAEKYSFIVDCGKENIEHAMPKEILDNDGKKNSKNKKEKEENQLFQGFPFHPDKVETILLTHCHLDHYGKGPDLFNLGCMAQVIVTPGTAELMKTAVNDAYEVDLMHGDINYNREDKQQFLSNMSIIKYNETRTLYQNRGNSILVTALYNAHLPGAAMYLVKVKDEEERLEQYFLFSGDYKVHSALCVEHEIPEYVYKLPINLFIESTYGLIAHRNDPIFVEELVKLLNQGKSKTFDDEMDEYEEYDAIQTRKGNREFKAILSRNKSHGGARKKIRGFRIRNDETRENAGNLIRNIVIPVISLERAQVVLYTIKCAKEAGLIPKNIPIKFDAPLANNYNWEFLNKESIELRPECKDFLPDNYTVERKNPFINTGNSQQILVVGGGMGHGPSKPYIEAALPRKDCAIFFTSYLAEGTLGRVVTEAVEGAKIPIGENEVRKNAIVKVTGEFSGHAHLLELLEFVNKFENLQSVAVVHGSVEARKSLIDAIRLFRKGLRVENFDRDVYITYIDNKIYSVRNSKYKAKGYNFTSIGTDNNSLKAQQKKRKKENEKENETQRKTNRKSAKNHKNMSRNNRIFTSSRNKAHKDSCHFRRR